MSFNQERTCHECGQKIIGRIDKRFCADQCRISFNNKLNSYGNKYIKNINNTLRKNRRILISLNTTGKSKVHVDKLKEQGFNFNYFTSIVNTKSGVYHYCYEQGYLSSDKNWYILVVQKES